MRKYFAATAIFVTLVFLAAISSCSKSPTAPPEVIPRTPEGIYRGYSSLDGSDERNVLLHIFEQDSNGHHSGTIKFDGVTTLLSQVTADSAGDSVFISYIRSGVLYSAKSRVSEVGLTLTYTSPGGIDPVNLNREIDGYNMSGEWTGQMLSYGLNIVRDANLVVSQTDALFDGTFNVNFFTAVTGDINSGVTSNESFQLMGTVMGGGGTSSFSALGSYFSADTITGNWYFGPNGSSDSGTFQFFRAY